MPPHPRRRSRQGHVPHSHDPHAQANRRSRARARVGVAATCCSWPWLAWPPRAPSGQQALYLCHCDVAAALPRRAGGSSHAAWQRGSRRAKRTSASPRADGPEPQRPPLLVPLLPTPLQFLWTSPARASAEHRSPRRSPAPCLATRYHRPHQAACGPARLRAAHRCAQAGARRARPCPSSAGPRRQNTARSRAETAARSPWAGRRSLGRASRCP